MSGLGRTALVAAFRRWSTRPADRFLQTAAALTAVSLVPPFLAGGDAATTASLVALHLVAAAVMVPALTRGLETVVTDLLDQRV